MSFHRRLFPQYESAWLTGDIDDVSQTIDPAASFASGRALAGEESAMKGASGFGLSVASYGQPCPVCNASTHRIPRRLIDLLLSIFTPVRRYRCRSMKCTWEGNLRVR
jgi:hypothetical protein